MKKFGLCLLLGLNALHAHTLMLKTGETLQGTLGSADKTQVEWVLESGEKKKVLISDLVAIDFGEAQKVASAPENFLTPAPQGPFSSPLQTFETWKAAALKDDPKVMSECYVKYQQKKILKDLKKISRAKRKEMQETAARTDFSPQKPFYQGDRASLEVVWRVGVNSDSQVLQFVLEDEQWKLVQ